MDELERVLRLRRLECLEEHKEHETDGVKAVKNGNEITYTFKNNEAGRVAYKMYRQLFGE